MRKCSPTALKTKMKTRVQDTRPVSQAHLDLSTAEIPRKMKMMVSAMLARVFIVYFTVVRDFWEMLASTYLLAPMPQKVILRGEEEEEGRKKEQRSALFVLSEAADGQQGAPSGPEPVENHRHTHTVCVYFSENTLASSYVFRVDADFCLQNKARCLSHLKVIL